MAYNTFYTPSCLEHVNIYLRVAQHASVCEEPDWENNHARSRVERHDRHDQEQNSGQGGHPPRPAATHFCGEAAGGRPDACGLQRAEGIDAASRAATARGCGWGAARVRRRCGSGAAQVRARRTMALWIVPETRMPRT
jgi:hypothetical protein